MTKNVGSRAYISGHHLIGSAVGLLCCGSVGWLWSAEIISIPSLTGNDQRLIPVQLIVPLGLAILIGQSFRNAMPELEMLASRRLWSVRLVHLSGMLGLALVVTVAETAMLGRAGNAVPAVRNLVGYTGLTLIGAQSLGARLSWLAPTTLALVSVTYAATASAELLPPWAWPVSQPATFASWMWVSTFAAGGLALLVKSPGYRTPNGWTHDHV